MKIAIVVEAAVITVVVAALWPRVGQKPSYHRFANTRGWMGGPNVWNVMINVCFVVVGAWGFVELGRRWVPAGERLIFGVLFGGIVLTGFGSADYHWAPDSVRLIWDRMQMTVVYVVAGGDGGGALLFVLLQGHAEQAVKFVPWRRRVIFFEGGRALFTVLRRGGL